MVSESIVIKNPTGLHVGPAGKLCKEAMKYKCRVSISHGQSLGNAKSVLSVLGACIKYGDEITLICEGEDEEIALVSLIELVRNGFGE